MPKRTPNRPKEVVVLDDSEEWLRFYTRLNEKKSSKFDFITFTTAHEALKQIKISSSKGRLFAAIVDFQLDGENNGLDFIRAARRSGGMVPYIIATQYSSQDLKDKGLDINEFIGSNVSYFVEKEYLRFDDNQNVDQIAESAYSIYQDTFRDAVRLYAKRNFELLGRWRASISAVVAKIDHILLQQTWGLPVVRSIEKPKANAEFVLVNISEIAAIRSCLLTVVGDMQTDHTKAAIFSFRKQTRSQDIGRTSVYKPAPDFTRLAALAANIAKLPRQNKGDFRGLSENQTERMERLHLAETLSTLVDQQSRYEGAMAISIALDDLMRKNEAEYSFRLAVGAADYYSSVDDPIHEVAFSTVAAQVSGRLGNDGERELCLRRADRVAYRSGRLSLQLELLAAEDRADG